MHLAEDFDQTDATILDASDRMMVVQAARLDAVCRYRLPVEVTPPGEP